VANAELLYRLEGCAQIQRARCPLPPQPGWLCYNGGLAGARPSSTEW